MVFPTEGKIRTWPLTTSFLHRLCDVYPNVDVVGQCRLALAKIETGAVEQKKAGGMPRFLWSWMERAQNGRAFPALRNGPTPPDREAEAVNSERP